MRTKRAFKTNYKTFFIFFEGESPTLSSNTLSVTSLWYFLRKCCQHFRKSRGVLKKRCSENMQQIYPCFATSALRYGVCSCCCSFLSLKSHSKKLKLLKNGFFCFNNNASIRFLSWLFGHVKNGLIKKISLDSHENHITLHDRFNTNIKHSKFRIHS